MNHDFYVAQSDYSNPMQYEYLLNDFPADIKNICTHIHHLFLHYADFNLFSASISPERFSEMNLRYLDLILKKMLALNSQSLTSARLPNERVIGICRDSSLLLCAVLRSRGIPARLRSGYVNYFIPGLFLDGVVVEYYDSALKRWRLVDTRTSEKQIHDYKLNITFDLTDLPTDKYILAADAWKQCRAGLENPLRFGSRQYRGLSVMRNRVIQDLALLNKQETLVWDLWGVMTNPIGDEVSLIDDLADELILHIHDHDRIRDLYLSNPYFQVSKIVYVDCPLVNGSACELRGDCVIH